MHFRKAIQDFTAVAERDVPPLESKAERSNDRDSELVLISFSDFKSDYSEEQKLDLKHSEMRREAQIEETTRMTAPINLFKTKKSDR